MKRCLVRTFPFRRTIPPAVPAARWMGSEATVPKSAVLGSVLRSLPQSAQKELQRPALQETRRLTVELEKLLPREGNELAENDDCWTIVERLRAKNVGMDALSPHLFVLLIIKCLAMRNGAAEKLSDLLAMLSVRDPGKSIKDLTATLVALRKSLQERRPAENLIQPPPLGNPNASSIILQYFKNVRADHRLALAKALLDAGANPQSVSEEMGGGIFVHDNGTYSTALAWAYFRNGERERGAEILGNAVTAWLAQENDEFLRPQRDLALERAAYGMLPVLLKRQDFVSGQTLCQALEKYGCMSPTILKLWVHRKESERSHLERARERIKITLGRALDFVLCIGNASSAAEVLELLDKAAKAHLLDYEMDSCRCRAVIRLVTYKEYGETFKIWPKIVRRSPKSFSAMMCAAAETGDLNQLIALWDESVNDRDYLSYGVYARCLLLFEDVAEQKIRALIADIQKERNFSFWGHGSRPPIMTIYTALMKYYLNTGQQQMGLDACNEFLSLGVQQHDKAFEQTRLKLVAAKRKMALTIAPLGQKVAPSEVNLIIKQHLRKAKELAESGNLLELRRLLVMITSQSLDVWFEQRPSFSEPVGATLYTIYVEGCARAGSRRRGEEAILEHRRLGLPQSEAFCRACEALLATEDSAPAKP